MARVAISTGANPNDGTGSNLRSAGGIINNNFLELYTYLGNGSSTVLSAPIWSSTSIGINTIRNVGIGTTNPTEKLVVFGNARVTGILTVGTGVTIDGNTGTIRASTLNINGQSITGAGVTSITAGSGISINQSIGNVTITATGGGGGTSSQWVTTSAGIHTTSNVGIGTTNPRGSLQVGTGITMQGSTGIISATQFAGNSLRFSTNNATIVGTAGTFGEIKQIGGAPFWYDGSQWREFFLINATPIVQTADTDWDKTILRSTFDTNINDVRFNVTPSKSDQSIDVVGSPIKVGTGSLRLNNQYLVYPHRTEYNFTGAWTIEGWIYFASVTEVGYSMGIIYKPNIFTLELLRNDSTTNKFRWYNPYTSAFDLLTVNTSAILNTWNHIALVRNPSNGSLHFYLNGVESANTTGTQIIDNNIQNFSNDLYLGLGGSYQLDAFIDDFRISTVARYTTNFTPPTTALPVTGSTTTIIPPPTDKSGVITLGLTPTWIGTSGVTVSRRSSGVYRLTYTSAYSNVNDYYVLSNLMDYSPVSGTFVHISRNTSYTEFTIARAGDNSFIDSGSLAVQIINLT